MTTAPQPRPEPCEYSGLPPAFCAHCQGHTTVVTIAEVERIIGRPAARYRLRPRALESRHTRDQWQTPVPQPIRCDDTHHRRGNRLLCRHCETELQRQIGDIPALVEDLNLAIRRARTFVDHGATPATPADPPDLGDGIAELGDPTNWTLARTIAPAAADTIHDLANTLPKRHPEPSKSAVAGARWLLAHWPDLMRRPDIDQLAAQISTAVARAHHVIDRPRDLTYLGPCPTEGCTWELWTDRADTHIHCRGCGLNIDRASYEQQLLDNAAEQYLTVDELVGRITAAGEPVTRRQIGHWIRAGIPTRTRHVPWWDDQGRIHTRHVPVYQLGAIRDRARQAEQDRADAERYADLEADAYTSRQVAELLGISTSRVRDLVAAGTLQPIRPAAKPLRFARATINAMTRPDQPPGLTPPPPVADDTHERSAQPCPDPDPPRR